MLKNYNFSEGFIGCILVERFNKSKLEQEAERLKYEEAIKNRWVKAVENKLIEQRTQTYSLFYSF